MNTASQISVGERVRFYRGTRSQSAVAGLAEITVEYLSMIERGVRTPTLPTLYRLAGVLGVSTSALLGEPVYEPVTGAGHPAIPEIRRAWAFVEPPSSVSEPPNVPALREHVEHVWKLWHSSHARLTEVGTLVPDLLRDVERAILLFNSAGEVDSRREAMRIAADLYSLLRHFCKYVGRPDLASVAADRTLRAAQAADDPLRIAAATWNLGKALLGEDRPDVAEEIALTMAEQLEHRMNENLDAAGLYGQLYLLATLTAVRRGDVRSARRLLREKVLPTAEKTGERNAYWTVFGPANVRVHAVKVEMDAGEAADGIRLADDVDVAKLGSIERRATFFMETARCYDLRRDDAGTLLYLQRAERESPEDVRYRHMAREMVRSLLKRARPSMLPEVRGLAARMAVYS